MEKLVQIIIYGSGIEKFKVFYFVYLTLISFWITNYLLNQYDDYFSTNSIKFNMNEFLMFFLSAKGIILFITFIFTFLVVLVYGRIFLLLFSEIVPLLYPSLLKILLIFVLLLAFRFKKIANVIKSDFSLLYILQLLDVININDGIKIKGKYFDIFEKIILKFQNPDDKIIDNQANIFSLLSSTCFVLFIYNIHIPFISKFIYIVFIYWLLNSSLIYKLWKIRRYLHQIILETDIQKNEHN